MKYQCTASVVFYHTSEEDVRGVLSSFVTNNTLRYWLIVIDHSKEDALRDICTTYEGVSYFHHPENRGFGAGHNIAIRKVWDDSPYHFVLNPDITFDSVILVDMIGYMNQHLAVGSMMPMIKDLHGRVQYLAKLLPSPIDLLAKRFLPTSYTDKRMRRFMLQDVDYSVIRSVPYLSGCFMALRMEALRKVGIFDERFFMYPEDIDLTRRLHRHYDTIYYPLVSIVHRHEASSYKSKKMLWIHATNMVKYFNKWGWIFDSERARFNAQVLKEIK